MAQTLAELLIRIKTEGSQAVKRELRDIEDALRKANAASERNIKSFERTQTRIIAGQKKMLTSAGGGGASSLGIDPKQLDAVTQALKDMSAPLNAVIDGATQFMQVFTLGSAKAQIQMEKLKNSMGLIRERLGGPDKMRDYRRFFAEFGFTDTGDDPLRRTRLRGLGIMSNQQYADIVRDMKAYNAASKELAQTEKNAIPIWERLTNAQKAGIVVGAAYVAVLHTTTSELAKFAINASKAGVEYESMRARIEGMDKKGSTTAQIFGLARSVAGPTKFTTKQMEEASVSLLAYGVNVERTLPLIGKLGQAFGADQEKLNQYTRAFGMLAAGQMPDTEVLGAMGVTKSALAKEGIKFDKGGGLISSTETVMVALEKIINTKYAKVIKETANTTEALRATTQDAFEGIQRYVGLAVNKGILPFEKTLGSIMQMIEGSMFPDLVAKNLISPITNLQDNLKTLEEQLKYTIALFAALGTAIPRQLGKAVDEWKNVSTQQNLVGGLQRVGSRSMTILRFIGGLFDPTGSGLGATETYGETIDRYLKEMNKKRPVVGPNTKRATDPFGGRDPFKGDGSDDGGKKTKKTLEKIENNTRKSAELLDLRRQTIGGGEIAALGITGAEIAGMGLRNRSEISLRSPIRPDTQVIRGIKDLVYGNMNFALQGSPINRVRF